MTRVVILLSIVGLAGWFGCDGEGGGRPGDDAGMSGDGDADADVDADADGDSDADGDAGTGPDAGPECDFLAQAPLEFVTLPGFTPSASSWSRHSPSSAWSTARSPTPSCPRRS